MHDHDIVMVMHMHDIVMPICICICICMTLSWSCKPLSRYISKHKRRSCLQKKATKRRTRGKRVHKTMRPPPLLQQQPLLLAASSQGLVAKVSMPDRWYLAWYPAFTLLYLPVIFFTGTWILYIVYTMGSSHPERPPLRMITEMFKDETFASSIICGMTVTMLAAGLFATGTLLDIASIGSSVPGSEIIRRDTRILGVHMAPMLHRVSFLVVLSLWAVICTSETYDQGWQRFAHAVATIFFMVSAALYLWILYVCASRLHGPNRNIHRWVALAGEMCCVVGAIVAGIGFTDFENGDLIIASGEMVILGGVTLTTMYLLWVLAQGMQNAYLLIETRHDKQ